MVLPVGYSLALGTSSRWIEFAGCDIRVGESRATRTSQEKKNTKKNQVSQNTVVQVIISGHGRGGRWPRIAVFSRYIPSQSRPSSRSCTQPPYGDHDAVNGLLCVKHTYSQLRDASLRTEIFIGSTAAEFPGQPAS